jgi:uncharacterized protein involved in cysteine biosynthesis
MTDALDEQRSEEADTTSESQSGSWRLLLLGIAVSAVVGAMVAGTLLVAAAQWVSAWSGLPAMGLVVAYVGVLGMLVVGVGVGLISAQLTSLILTVGSVMRAFRDILADFLERAPEPEPEPEPLREQPARSGKGRARGRR